MYIFFWLTRMFKKRSPMSAYISLFGLSNLYVNILGVQIHKILVNIINLHVQINKSKANLAYIYIIFCMSHIVSKFTHITRWFLKKILHLNWIQSFVKLVLRVDIIYIACRRQKSPFKEINSNNRSLIVLGGRTNMRHRPK